MKYTESKEDYLERILMLKEEQEHVRAIDIVNSMGFSKPSVSIAIKKLKDLNLITIESKTNYIELTNEGKKIAENVYKRHKVISKLLIHLGVDEKTALEDACKIEHDISPETFKQLERAYNEIS